MPTTVGRTIFGVEMDIQKIMIVSIHEYILNERSEPEDFKSAVTEAENRELFNLPGLVAYQFLYGIKGSNREQFAAIWEYESREAWEALWGSPDEPISEEEYPEKWRVWEDELLAPLLNVEPDNIRYTSYVVISHHNK